MKTGSLFAVWALGWVIGFGGGIEGNNRYPLLSELVGHERLLSARCAVSG